MSRNLRFAFTAGAILAAVAVQQIGNPAVVTLATAAIVALAAVGIIPPQLIAMSGAVSTAYFTRAKPAPLAAAVTAAHDAGILVAGGGFRANSDALDIARERGVRHAPDRLAVVIVTHGADGREVRRHPNNPCLAAPGMEYTLPVDHAASAVSVRFVHFDPDEDVTHAEPLDIGPC